MTPLWRVWSLDIDRLVCPDLPRCEVVVDGLITRRDRTHLTGTFSAHLAPSFGALLDEEGVAAPAG
jgi:hypothetical protein